MNTGDAIDAGYDLANQNSVALWGIGAFFFTLIVLLVVHLRSPKLPVELAAQVESDDLPLFERAYVERLKQRQVRAAWIGAIISFAIGIFIFTSLALLSMTLSMSGI